MAETPLPALVLAGGPPDKHVAAHFGLPHKALVPLADQPAVCWVTDALLAAREVGPVLVATQHPEVAQVLSPQILTTSPAGPGFLDTVMAGFLQFPQADRLLVCTSDLPLLTPEAVDDFTRRALDSGAELCYSIVEGSRLEGLPGAAERVLVRLREGRFTGGNLACLSRSFVLGQGRRIQGAFAGRKSQLRLALLLGPSFIFRLLTGRLDLPQIVRKAERLMGVSCAVIDSSHLGICYDLDEPVHVKLAAQLLERRLHPRP